MSVPKSMTIGQMMDQQSTSRDNRTSDRNANRRYLSFCTRHASDVTFIRYAVKRLDSKRFKSCYEHVNQKN